MFTGIISHQGTIKSIHPAGVTTISVTCSFDTAPIAIGGSIAIDGVCLTVTKKEEDRLYFDIMQVTLDKTNLKDKREGDRVHIELPLVVGDEYGGHMLSGHVDTTTTVISTKKDGDALWIHFDLPKEYVAAFVPQGSIAINGVSLTIADLSEDAFGVSLIPHTQHVTTLSALSPGETVNVECDMLAKQVASIVSNLMKFHDRYRKN